MATGVMQASPEGSKTYTYSSQPRAVQQRKKYREQPAYGNIMYDKRIVRGNTYALHTLPASSQPDPLELQRQQESRRRALARKRAREQFKPRSPEPVEGRRHIEVQTELYLEEITDRVEEADVHTQTDAFLDRPPTPLFIPAKTGQDVATQIEEGDLFDFDLEVKPIVEVLVGKTVEQALLEVMEEEELASLRAQQRQFEENRNSELVETQRLEEQERRRREEKERRMQQQREALLKEKETAEKIAARAFAQSYLSDLVPSVFSNLSEGGFFYDPVEREVETVFMPYLLDEAEKQLEKKVLARTVLDCIIQEVVAKMLGVPVPEFTQPPPPPANQPTETAATEAGQQQDATSQATEAAKEEEQKSSEPLTKVFGEQPTTEETKEEKEEKKDSEEVTAAEEQPSEQEQKTEETPDTEKPVETETQEDPPSQEKAEEPKTEEPKVDEPQPSDPPSEAPTEGDKPPENSEEQT